MVQEIGESREAWGWDVWHKAEEIANKMKSEDKPFYIVYACKQDKAMSNMYKTGVYKQAFKIYSKRPKAILGILVWYVDNKLGEFKLIPELSSPPDIPLDPSLLSDKAADASASVMEQGKKLGVIVS